MTTEATPGGQTKITKGQYRTLSPYSKGYVHYMQEAWNEEIPKGNPYKETSPNFKEWNRGEQSAMLSVMDADA